MRNAPSPIRSRVFPGISRSVSDSVFVVAAAAAAEVAYCTVLLAGSYGFSDIWHLRSMAIAAGVAMLGFNYYHPNGKPSVLPSISVLIASPIMHCLCRLWLPFKWNLLFILTNSLHLLYLLSEEKKAEHMPMVLQHIYEEVFEPVNDSSIRFCGMKL